MVKDSSESWKLFGSPEDPKISHGPFDYLPRASKDDSRRKVSISECFGFGGILEQLQRRTS